ncbi:MAG: DUF1176 domain-containing protein [Gammaproteobacteria bacterium]
MATLAIQGCQPRIATEPVSHVTSMPPEWRHRSRQSWRAVLDWPDSCEQGFDRFDPGWNGVQLYTLRTTFLVEVTCTRGAYQGSQIYYHVDQDPRARRIQPIRFRTFEVPSADAADVIAREDIELWGSPEFRAETGELVVFNKFRGLGDCGSLSTYKLDGARARLQSFKLKAHCDGEGANKPESWVDIMRRP